MNDAAPVVSQTVGCAQLGEQYGEVELGGVGIDIDTVYSAR